MRNGFSSYYFRWEEILNYIDIELVNENGIVDKMVGVCDIFGSSPSVLGALDCGIIDKNGW